MASQLSNGGAVVDILVLGAGWLSTFLLPLCRSRHLVVAATTRSGSTTAIQFEFDPRSDDPKPFEVLPGAQTVLITFPIKERGASERLVTLYRSTHSGLEPRFIQLGTTSIWGGRRGTTDGADLHRWYDRHSAWDPNHDRAHAESELLALAPGIPTTVLNLAGLWGAERSTRNWVFRVAPTKDALRNKGSLHMIHGLDVSRAVLAVHAQFTRASGQRWILTDGRVYDWWDLASAWGTGLAEESGPGGPHAAWVMELMQEHAVRALPRGVELLGRALDARDFWATFGLAPLKARLDES